MSNNPTVDRAEAVFEEAITFMLSRGYRLKDRTYLDTTERCCCPVAAILYKHLEERGQEWDYALNFDREVADILKIPEGWVRSFTWGFDVKEKMGHMNLDPTFTDLGRRFRDKYLGGNSPVKEALSVG